MDFITSIRLKNFRGFQESERIAFTPLTFLVGPNSSGKSSLSTAIFLFAQSSDESQFWRAPNWMGKLVDLGSFSDTVYRHVATQKITIEIGINWSPETAFRYGRGTTWKEREMIVGWTIRSSRSSPLGETASFTITDALSGAKISVSQLKSEIKLVAGDQTMSLPRGKYDFRYPRGVFDELSNSIQHQPPSSRGKKAGFLRIVDYLQAGMFERFFSQIERVPSARAGPKRWYPKGELRDPDQILMIDDPLAGSFEFFESQFRRRNNRRRSPDAMGRYLQKLGIASDISNIDLSAYHSGINVTDSVSKVKSNLADVGFGASQVIPVLRGCSSFSESALFIEQPEIHLHPKAQGQLAELICEKSLERQVIVETHSEHMINRARLMVAEGRIKAEDVSIIYVDRDNIGSNTTQIGLTPSGDFTRAWPEGFFDERYKDSLKLLEINSEAKSNEKRASLKGHRQTGKTTRKE